VTGAWSEGEMANRRDNVNARGGRASARRRPEKKLNGAARRVLTPRDPAAGWREGPKGSHAGKGGSGGREPKDKRMEGGRGRWVKARERRGNGARARAQTWVREERESAGGSRKHPRARKREQEQPERRAEINSRATRAK